MTTTEVNVRELAEELVSDFVREKSQDPETSPGKIALPTDALIDEVFFDLIGEYRKIIQGFDKTLEYFVPGCEKILKVLQSVTCSYEDCDAFLKDSNPGAKYPVLETRRTMLQVCICAVYQLRPKSRTVVQTPKNSLGQKWYRS